MQTPYFKEKEEGDILDLDFLNYTRISKGTTSKSWLTVPTDASCHCSWKVVRCPLVCLRLAYRLLSYIFLRPQRSCLESRPLSETKRVRPTETCRRLSVWLKMRLRKSCVHHIRAVLAQADSARRTQETMKARLLLVFNYKMLARQRSSSAALPTGLSVQQSITAWLNTHPADRPKGWNQMVFVQHHTGSHYC